ncbi:MAG TPA: cupin domain-containing protein [Candidatus Deferrimicrobium sp.]|nr:cupin domain-containing protein [Candidatus Deferrimicrobium sp.]
MVFKLKEKCLKSQNKEVYYGAILNKEIQDVYLGMSILEPGESRTEGPGKGHEEIFYVLEGQLKIIINDREIILNEGEAYFIPNGFKNTVTNLSSKRSYLIMAGGHPQAHSHTH